MCTLTMAIAHAEVVAGDAGAVLCFDRRQGLVLHVPCGPSGGKPARMCTFRFDLGVGKRRDDAHGAQTLAGGGFAPLAGRGFGSMVGFVAPGAMEDLKSAG